MMTRNIIALLSAFMMMQALANDDKPNIVMIMVDDLGWSDLGCYGGEINTPNLDYLAEKGVRFRRFFNNAKCGSSRVNLLMGDGLKASQMQYNLPTLGHVLKSAGYHTYASGKHHSTTNLYERGFDRYYGLRDGMCNHFNPGLQREGEPVPLGKKGRERMWCDDALTFKTKDPAYQHYFPKGFYSTDAFTNKALEYLDSWKEADSGNPFFLYIAYTAPHDPLHAWPRDIAKYEGKYAAGYGAIRQARYKKQIEMGLINEESYPLSPATHDNWAKMQPGDKAQQEDIMEIYAAMIDCIDQKIGLLVEKLKAFNQYENTIIMFCSDNGGEKVGSRKVQENMGSVGSYVSPGQDWANVSNTPFREYKTSAINGGSRTPMILHWPKGIANPGRFTDKFGHLVDVMPTVIALSGATYPNPDHTLQGESFLDVIQNTEQMKEKPTLMLRGPERFIIDGTFKLVSTDGENWSLYNLSKDETELNDLAKTNSKKYDELLHKFNSWASSK